MSAKPSKPTVVFAGGGHAQLYSLKRTAQLVRKGYEVVLVNPGPFLYYSGMATGVLSRFYRPEEGRIDVRRLVERGSGRFVEGRVREVRPGDRGLVLEDGAFLRYDAASMALGSAVPVGDLPANATPVKPVARLEGLYEDLSSLTGSPRVLVIGGGAAGCEVACNILKVFREHETPARLSIAERGDALLGEAPKKAQKGIERFLRSSGVEVLLETGVRDLKEGVALTRDGRRLPFEVLILASGVAPPEVFRRSGLLTGSDGSLWVNRYLQSASDPRIFGGGDSVAFRGDPLPRLGVFAIRQGPVLYHNLQALLEGKPFKAFRPQRRYLYALNLSDGTGLAVWGPLAWRGRAALWLKDYIDRSFVREYR